MRFGVRLHLASVISEFERPTRFADETVQGQPEKLKHVHEFIPQESGILMLDTLVLEFQFSIIGVLVDRIILTGYIRRLLIERNACTKRLTENRQSDS